MAKLLLIEDEPGVQEYFKAVVSRMGHELVTADNGPAGLKALEESAFDVVMTDLNMPGEPNGMALVRKLRELYPSTPVVVVSGYPTKERLDQCSELGIEDFLTKPFEMTFFSAVITRLLGEKGSQ